MYVYVLYKFWIWILNLNNGCDSVSNHQPHNCLLNGLFRCRSKKTWKLRVTGICAGNSPGTSEFPAQMASNMENVSIWWRHHENIWIMMISRYGRMYHIIAPSVQENHWLLVDSLYKGCCVMQSIYGLFVVILNKLLDQLFIQWFPAEFFNSFWPRDTIWRHRSKSTLVQVMACCLTAPSHYMNQWWLIINNVLGHSPEGISQEMLQISIIDVTLKMTSLKLQHFPGAIELTWPTACWLGFTSFTIDYERNQIMA